MKRYAARRFFYSPVILSLVFLIVFVMIRPIAGDPVRAVMTDNFDLTEPNVVERGRGGYGLDRSIPVQFLFWLRDRLKRNWGTSLHGFCERKGIS